MENGSGIGLFLRQRNGVAIRSIEFRRFLPFFNPFPSDEPSRKITGLQMINLHLPFSQGGVDELTVADVDSHMGGTRGFASLEEDQVPWGSLCPPFETPSARDGCFGMPKFSPARILSLVSSLASRSRSTERLYFLAMLYKDSPGLTVWVNSAFAAGVGSRKKKKLEK